MSFSEFGSVKEKRGSYSQPFGYTGYQYDNTSNLYFAQARYYDPALGRFVSEDRVKGNIIRPDTINPYIYCLSNPLKYVDLDGNALSLFGTEYTHTKEVSFDFEIRSSPLDLIIVNQSTSEEVELYSSEDSDALITVYAHNASDGVSNSVGINLFSVINLDLSLEKITLSVSIGEYSLDAKLGLEETGLTLSRKKDNFEETFGIVAKIYDGYYFYNSIGLTYSTSNTVEDVTTTTTTDVGINFLGIVLALVLGTGGAITTLGEFLLSQLEKLGQQPQPSPSCNI